MYFGWETDLPNLWSTEYSLPEGAYLAGYLAAAASRSGNVGIFGGYQYPVVVSSMNCFSQGVRDYNAAHQRDVAVLGWNIDTQQGLFADDFLSPDQGALLTNDLFSQGADIIFPVAGHALESTGYGTIVFARQHEGVYIIGVDLDWAWAMPGSANRIITSVEARYEQSIALAVDALANGEFHGGSHMATLATGEITLSPLRDFSYVVSSDLNAELTRLANSASVNSHQMNKNIIGILNLDSVGGENWPSNIWLTIHIFAAPGGPLLFTGESMTDQSGGFYQDLGVDLKPGMVVEVSDCLDTRSVTLVPLTIDVIDPDGDIVSGTAPSGAKIFVVVSKGADLWVTADRNGLWQASFAGKFDITNQTTAQAIAMDEYGNGTAIKTVSTLALKPTPPPLQTPEPVSTSTPTATILLLPSLSPTVIQPVGERISLSNANTVPRIEFPAGKPFYIQHGWTDSPDPIQLGFGYKLEVDGVLRNQDSILRTVDNNQQITQEWTYIFSSGMTGTHIFTGYHLSSCQYALENGRVTSCVSPDETVVFGIHTLTVDFIP
jgi:hypothetical protein